MADFNKAIEKTLVNEGGYVFDPDDAGGETKYGISKRYYPSVDIKNLTQDEAKAIYKRDYWDRLKADDIESQNVAFDLFDTAVNMGVRTASKIMQLCVDSHPDGIIGAKTLHNINNTQEELLLLRFRVAKIARYVHITQIRPKNKKYLIGWINRTLGV